MINLRPYQKEAISATYNWFGENPDGHPVIVLPTGSGKSLINAKLCEEIMQWPKQRILCLTHVKELIEQNYQKLFDIWSDAPAGIYCAGLDRKQHHHPITFGTIQSVHRKAELINWRDVIIIDECHLLSEEDGSMYRSFLSRMKAINPAVKIIGLSATPYRMKSGYLHLGENAIFSGISYELPILRLIKEGYLVGLRGKHADTQGNTNKIGLQGGEFILREAITEFDRAEMTKAAVQEMTEVGHDRKSWLIFCVSIEHAEHIQAALIEKGIDCGLVCDETPKGERARLLDDLRGGRIRALVNVSVLTTGFDAPGIDMLVLLRPTMSPGLLVQMCGRGMRPVYAPGMPLDTVEERLAAIAGGTKPNCFVLDMAGNLERHGPITHIKAPDPSRRLNKKEKQGKVCKYCKTVNPLDATQCIECGKTFEGGGARTIKHGMRASTAAAISDAPVMGDAPVWLDVNHVNFEIHNKPGSPASLKVGYNCKPNYVLEWVCFGHTGFAKDKADRWWFARGGNSPAPMTALMALQRLEELSRFKTRRIKAKKEGKFSRIESYDLVPANMTVINASGNLGMKMTQVERVNDEAITA